MYLNVILQNKNYYVCINHKTTVMYDWVVSYDGKWNAHNREGLLAVQFSSPQFDTMIMFIKAYVETLHDEEVIVHHVRMRGSKVLDMEWQNHVSYA